MRCQDDKLIEQLYSVKEDRNACLKLLYDCKRLSGCGSCSQSEEKTLNLYLQYAEHYMNQKAQ